MTPPVSPTNLTDEQWGLVGPLLLAGAEHRRGPKVRNPRRRLDALLHIASTGCQWRSLPVEYGTWGEAWGSFRRWSRAGAFAPVLLGLHGQVRLARGDDAQPSWLAVGSTRVRGRNVGAGDVGGGEHARWADGTKRFLAVDGTGLPLASLVTSARVTESVGVAALLRKLSGLGATDLLTTVHVGARVSSASASRLSIAFAVDVQRTGRVAPVALGGLAAQVERAPGQLDRSRPAVDLTEQARDSANAWLELAAIHLNLSAWSAHTSQEPRPTVRQAS